MHSRIVNRVLRSSKRRNLSSSRRTDRLDNKPPLARIRFSNRLKNRHPSRTYLGDGGTEEGVGRSLTNHTYRSFASPFVSQSINPMRRRDRGIQSIKSIRCDATHPCRHIIHPSIHPFIEKILDDVPYASLPKDGAPSSPPLEFLRTMVAPRRAVVVVLETTDTAVVVLFTWASMLLMS